ncbi:class II aldolase/adducin family protein [Haloarcula amylovorans]|uniref:class II aldolase/adducin family protein n=1 Tax=Haloarcula amylovorans TaxID=2562280 RepID=UPI001ADD799A|nr:class II aldolase/adducin family protein [Halomicroarcula amylolytica]
MDKYLNDVMAEELVLGEERAAVAKFGREMLDKGLTEGVGGNLSQRGADGKVAISPSGIPYGRIDAEDVPIVTTDAEHVEGELDPSSETPMHTMIYRERPDVGAIVHTHSPYATTFAALGEEIPASHYLVEFVGTEIPVAKFDLPGSEELGQHAVDALGDEYNGCLLQNHGVIAVGDTVEHALETAQMIEYTARIHYQARNIGDPIVLDDEEIEALIEGLDEYRNLK